MKEIGYVFNLDGTLVDTQTPFHATAECKVLSNHGVSIHPEEISERFDGVSTRAVFKELAPEQNPDVLMVEKWREMEALLNTQELNILDPDIGYILSLLDNRKIPVAIASASPRSWIEKCIKQETLNVGPKLTGRKIHNLRGFFGTKYVSAQDCARPKPYPDVLLKAKQMLEAKYGSARQWVAVGDGESDVKAGLAADMSVIFLSKKNAGYDQHEKVSRVKSVSEMRDVFSNQLEGILD
jgi:beta-phosphoglucomutase-like phosphatase (HAD superfamily)